MTDSDYEELLRTDMRNTHIAEQVGVSEAKVRRDRKRLARGARVALDYNPTSIYDRVRVLVLDVETRPMLGYFWGLWDQNIGINQIVEPSRVMCFAAKWVGDKNVEFYSEYADGYENVVTQMHRLLSEADIVVTYNGDRFDIKKMNNEFLNTGFGPPRPFKSIDLIKTNKGRFELPSRKLDYLVQYLGVGAKMPNSGMDLWIGCVNGDAESWKIMEKYNRQDVVVTEGAYLKLQPWLTNIPHLGMFTGDEYCCPYCGGVSLTADGFTHTNVQSYELHRCEDCNGWARGTTPLQNSIRTRAIR